MKTEHYAQALVAMVKKGATPADAVKSLADHLDARGKGSMLKRLPLSLAKSRMEEDRKEHTVLEVAHQKDIDVAQKAAVGFGIAHTKTKTDESLIGGWRLVGHSTLVDNSYRKHLLDFYKKLTR